VSGRRSERRRAARRDLVWLAAGLLAAALLGSATGAVAGGARSWNESPATLARGTADGVAVAGDGSLFPSPRVAPLGTGTTPGEAGQVWSVVADRSGNVFLGTGPHGRILKFAPSGTRTRLARVDEPLVTALATLPDGSLLAAASPGGRIYRVTSDGSVETWAETDEPYVWCLAVAGDGTVFAGTGGRGGRVLRLDRSGRDEPFFDSNESHIMALALRDDGALFAGGAGAGLLYEIDPEGHAIVHHDGALPEVASIALEPGGGIVAAWLAPPDRESERPALRLTLPDGTRVGSSDETVGALEQRRGPVLRGTIEGLAEDGRAEPARRRGAVLRIEPDGGVVELWSSEHEAPFSLAGDMQGRVHFGAGEPARLYRVEPGGEVARLASLDEAQLTALVRHGQTLIAATSGPAAAYRLGPDTVETASFDSAPVDAGATARWGRIRWTRDGGVGRVELYTRTGNSSRPDGTWSAWSPALTDPEGSAIVNPDGRFLQWRARFVGAREPAVRLAEISVTYQPYNRAPRARGFRLQGDATAVAAEATFTWSASDADGDPLELELQVRPVGAESWSVAGRGITVAEGSRTQSGADEWVEGSVTWDTRSLEEGLYEVRARIGDHAANDPDEAHRVALEPALRVAVDRTPPELRIVAAERPGELEIVVSDVHSAVDRLELVRDGRVVSAPRPADGLCDSATERFRVSVAPDSGGWVARGVDAAGNRTEEALSAAQ
jgi:hypothetical protein